jgi:hypothetical protein
VPRQYSEGVGRARYEFERKSNRRISEMKARICFAFLIALLIPALATAQSVFNGTWKVNVNTVKFPEKPDVFLVQNGMYECKTCVPPIQVKADGEDHQISGHPYFDTMNVKVIDNRTIEEIDKKNGKTVATSKTWVSADGKTLTSEFNDSSNTNGAPVTGKFEATRVAEGPAGANEVSGSWKAAKVENLSENAVTFTYQVSADTVTMTSPTGQSYTAKLDGTEAPFHGDPGVTTVSIKKLGSNTLEETDNRDGKVISVSRMTVSADGKTMEIAISDKLHGTHSSATATKQ